MNSNYDWTLLCEEKIKEINLKTQSPGFYRMKESKEAYYFSFIYMEENKQEQVLPGSYRPKEFYTALISFEKGLEMSKKMPNEKLFQGQCGLITYEKTLSIGYEKESSLGIQISHDNKKAWIYINENCVIRYKAQPFI